MISDVRSHAYALQFEGCECSLTIQGRQNSSPNTMFNSLPLNHKTPYLFADTICDSPPSLNCMCVYVCGVCACEQPCVCVCAEMYRCMHVCV